MLLMRMVGYKCWEDYGELKGTGHVWNAMRVDGELRFVDVGWFHIWNNLYDISTYDGKLLSFLTKIFWPSSY